ncbi:MAG TPA: cobalt-precorrin-5B (C(1))-methyltransferase [Candidatus Acidoferrum sp.]|nr:cobalt-precorrin-5B (C(1))-methyltransferase [Candidatus Acidoferrum sp.]
MEKKLPLRRGWTTGACATAATKAAYVGLVSGRFPDPVEITLPIGKVAFALAVERIAEDAATAGVVKDAGDDPDVTHGALVLATVRRGEPGSGVAFRAGAGVGTVTKPGLPVAVGEPAINPVPRRLMCDAIAEAAAALGERGDVVIELAIPNGEELAKRTLNPRLGIIGGLSILGTTGVVTPYSCSAWIASIREGIDVARALGLPHVAGSTGTTSEATVARFHDLPESALIDMGDFAGGMLKYVRARPVPRVTIAGGFAKIAKLAQGSLDLHSQRSRLDLARLAALASELGAPAPLTDRIAAANTGLEALQLADAAALSLAEEVARCAHVRAQEVLRDAPIALDVLVVNRDGEPIAHAS